jgi:hypothetical protein
MNAIQTLLLLCGSVFAALAERQKCLVRTLFTPHGMLPAVLVAAHFFTAPGIWWLGKNDFERLGGTIDFPACSVADNHKEFL